MLRTRNHQKPLKTQKLITLVKLFNLAFLCRDFNVQRGQFLSEIERISYSIKPVKRLSPAQSKIDNLKQQKDTANKNLKAERDRQKIAKAQATIRQASSF